MEEQGKINTYRDLHVWRKSMDLTRQIYEVTRNFPGDERFGLTSQIRRCAVSIPSNIAEGQARRTPNEFIHFLYIAKGSLAELDTQLTLALDFSYLDAGLHKQLQTQIESLQRMLFNLVAKQGGTKMIFALPGHNPQPTTHNPQLTTRNPL